MQVCAKFAKQTKTKNNFACVLLNQPKQQSLNIHSSLMHATNSGVSRLESHLSYGGCIMDNIIRNPDITYGESPCRLGWAAKLLRIIYHELILFVIKCSQCKRIAPHNIPPHSRSRDHLDTTSTHHAAAHDDRFALALKSLKDTVH